MATWIGVRGGWVLFAGLVSCHASSVGEATTDAASDTGATGTDSSPALDGASDSGCPSEPLDTCPDGMVVIPGGCWENDLGEFLKIKSFCLDTREVTLDAYQGCATAKGCPPTP